MAYFSAEVFGVSCVDGCGFADHAFDEYWGFFHHAAFHVAVDDKHDFLCSSDCGDGDEDFAFAFKSCVDDFG